MFKTIKRIIKWTGEDKKRLYLGFVYSFFLSILTALPVMGAAYVLNLIILDMNGSQQLSMDWVLYILAFLILLVLGRALFSYLRAKSQESIGYEITAKERIEIGNILKKVSLGFFDSNNAGKIASAVTTDFSYVEMYGMKMIDNVVNGYICTLTMILCLAFYNYIIALICLAGVGLSAVFLRLLSNRSNRNAPVHQEAQDSMIAATIEYIRGIPIVKAFKQVGVSREGIEKAYRKSRDINVKIEMDYVPANCLHLFSLKLASVAVVLAAATMAAKGEMAIPNMLMMLIFSFIIFGHVESINNAAHVLEIIDATMDKLEKIKEAEFIDKNGKELTLSSYDIEFKNVSFAYEQKDVIKSLSFKIPEKTTTAIVGPSGSGKTTICSLLARFYDVSKGSISIGGRDIREMSCNSLLRNISMVFQNVYLFHDTVYNNIKFGNPEAGKEEVIEAAKKACCHEFIMKLPERYQTVIGDTGSTLSGGEKQRISIARAILKDASIVILDEATASVDPENEHKIQGAITSLVKGKTMITIAHRLATIENADQILVVDDGEIVQQGSHKELIREGKIYKKFMSIREKAEGWTLA
ncbi:ATP-binding cassette domain-containing protein [Iocasia frigidifontis]|uniref:ATP-binding cassette domain-containing protein n=1 Tax=Iocasia fonsfrigidae TaxID=2682810 RepID=A0A8A7KC78_9FIRM|nr:ABC transporter ATP-binding protein [Iocasia fonsfrigidae]QTL98850.1 ATP-binding cassette domain-containing protein [Iocasia fonsfrigidae]